METNTDIYAKTLPPSPQDVSLPSIKQQLNYPFDFTSQELLIADIVSKLVFKGLVAPTSRPNFIGQIFCDTALGKVYIATATASSSDWKILN